VKYGIFKNIIILVVLVFFQKTLISYISLSSVNITPDIILIFIMAISVKEGRLSGSLYGFFTGLLFDLLSGSFLGLSALCYSITSFIAGNFKTENNKFLTKYYFILIVLFGAIISNLIYFTFYFQGSPIEISKVILNFVLTSATYTAILSIFYVIIPRRKNIDRGYTLES
jgi:rod shape-determining protein MreD